MDYVPGWDCHGLPIELKALEKSRAQASETAREPPDSPLKDALAVRRAARKLATATVEDQKKSFRQWGIMADWDNAWKTMDKSFEVKQLEVFKRMVNRGLIYRQRKPVYWSPSSRTALAEAELEYRNDHLSTAAFVRFPLSSLPDHLMAGLDKKAQVCVLIWTTTPWTLPANRAIAVQKDLKYAIVENKTHGRLILAESRVKEVEKMSKLDFIVVGSIKGSDLVGSTYRDEMFDSNAVPRPILHANFVSADSGTGLVHVAPGHGTDDYELGLNHGIPAFAPIDDAGCFTAQASPDEPAMLEGKHILIEGNSTVLEILSRRRVLVCQHGYTHKYPYDWRSKQPVVLRATEQWFANIGDVQEVALKALESVKFTPEGGKVRLQSFIKNRSEWCISRQRAWGVPIPALYHKETGEALLTGDSVSHIISVIAERGTDAWWSDDELDPAWTPPTLRDDGHQTPYKRGKDTMDVWFDSGTSWTQAKTADHVADIYLEGTDQHRGWFQSSLLTFVAHEGSENSLQAPFRSLVTHGFTLDKHGRKMSKSIGNVVSPDEIINGTLLPPLKKKVKGKVTEFRDSMGVDALRLWVASSDYTKDVAVNPVALKAVNNNLTKYRVTFKQLLGILQDYESASPDVPKGFGKVHKIAIWQLERVEDTVRTHYQDFEYHKAMTEINRYIHQDLSAFYFEAIKDAAYCGNRQERIMVQATCHIIQLRLQHLLAPVTPLLVQETWEHTPDQIKSNHGLPPFQRSWMQSSRSASGKSTVAPNQSPLSNQERQQLDHDGPSLMHALAAVQEAQEQARSAKQMGSSLQSFVILQLGPGNESSPLNKYSDDLATILVVSRVDICAGSLPDSVAKAEWSYQSKFSFRGTTVVAHVYAPQSSKCVRCWRYAAPMDAKKEEALCQRCEGIVEELRLKEPQLFEGEALVASAAA